MADNETIAPPPPGFHEITPADIEGMVRKAAEKYDLDPDHLSRLAKVESGFLHVDPATSRTLRSSAGALGVMQLMPDTAKQLGVDPHDRDANIDGGARYFRQLYDRYGGDYQKATAAYNAGPGTVDNGKTLPRETQQYVKAIMPEDQVPPPPPGFHYVNQPDAPPSAKTTSGADKPQDDSEDAVPISPRGFAALQRQLGATADKLKSRESELLQRQQKSNEQFAAESAELNEQQKLFKENPSEALAAVLNTKVDDFNARLHAFSQDHQKAVDVLKKDYEAYNSRVDAAQKAVDSYNQVIASSRRKAESEGRAPVRGMEQLGGARPGPGPAQTIAGPIPQWDEATRMGTQPGPVAPPNAIAQDTSAEPSEYAKRIAAFKLGQEAPPSQPNPLDVMASGIESMAGAATPTKKDARLTGDRSRKTDEGREMAAGASEFLHGALGIVAHPIALGPALALNPLGTIGTLVAGTAAAKGAEAGLESTGVPKEYATLGGDVAGLLVGGGIGKKVLERIDSRLEAHNSAAERWLAQEQAGGRRAATMQDAFSGESYPVVLESGQNARLEYMGTAATETGRPISGWRVVAEDGKVLRGGPAGEVRQWLADHGAKGKGGEIPEGEAPEPTPIVRQVEKSGSASEQGLDAAALMLHVEEMADRLRSIRSMEKWVAEGKDIEVHPDIAKQTTPEQRLNMLREYLAEHRKIYEQGWKDLVPDVGQDVVDSLRQKVESKVQAAPTLNELLGKEGKLPLEEPAPSVQPTRQKRGKKQQPTPAPAQEEEQSAIPESAPEAAGQRPPVTPPPSVFPEEKKEEEAAPAPPAPPAPSGPYQQGDVFRTKIGDYEVTKADGKNITYEFTGKAGQSRSASMPLVDFQKLAGKAEKVPAQPSVAEQPVAPAEETSGLGEVPRQQEAPAAAPEAEKPTAYDFASTQLNLPDPLAGNVKKFAQSIPDKSLAEDGREDQPHVTVKFGLHGEDPEKVRKLLADQAPIPVTLGKASLFKNDDAHVLKLDVDSPELHALNKKISDALPNTDTHPEYQPHVTIAYLKPGEGKKYDGKPVPGLTGKSVTIDTLHFSDKAGKLTEIPLAGNPNSSAAPAEETSDSGAVQPAQSTPQYPRPASFVKGSRYEAEDDNAGGGGAASTYEAVIKEQRARYAALENLRVGANDEKLKPAKRQEFQKKADIAKRTLDSAYAGIGQAFGPEWVDRARAEVLAKPSPASNSVNEKSAPKTKPKEYAFTDEKFMSAKDKSLVLKQWITFLKNGLREQDFTDRLYAHLEGHAEFSAHYDKAGFYGEFFRSGDDTKRFLHQFDQVNNPQGKSAELGTDIWLKNYNGAGVGTDLNRAMVETAAPYIPELLSKADADQKAADLAEAERLKQKHEPAVASTENESGDQSGVRGPDRGGSGPGSPQGSPQQAEAAQPVAPKPDKRAIALEAIRKKFGGQSAKQLAADLTPKQLDAILKQLGLSQEGKPQVKSARIVDTLRQPVPESVAAPAAPTVESAAGPQEEASVSGLLDSWVQALIAKYEKKGSKGKAAKEANERFREAGHAVLQAVFRGMEFADPPADLKLNDESYYAPDSEFDEDEQARGIYREVRDEQADRFANILIQRAAIASGKLPPQAQKETENSLGVTEAAYDDYFIETENALGTPAMERMRNEIQPAIRAKLGALTETAPAAPAEPQAAPAPPAVEPPATRNLWHVTDAEAARNIRANGFKPSQNGELGRGVYLIENAGALTAEKFRDKEQIPVTVSGKLLQIADGPNRILQTMRALYGRQEGTAQYDKLGDQEKTWDEMRYRAKEAGYVGLEVRGESAEPKNVVVFDPASISLSAPMPPAVEPPGTSQKPVQAEAGTPDRTTQKESESTPAYNPAAFGNYIDSLPAAQKSHARLYGDFSLGRSVNPDQLEAATDKLPDAVKSRIWKLGRAQKKWLESSPAQTPEPTKAEQKPAEEKPSAPPRAPKWGTLTETESEILHNLQEDPAKPMTLDAIQSSTSRWQQTLDEEIRGTIDLLAKHGLVRRLPAGQGYIRTVNGTVALGKGPQSAYAPGGAAQRGGYTDEELASWKDLIHSSTDEAINEIEAGERAMRGTPGNAWLHADALDKQLPALREYREKAPLSEAQQKALDSTIRAAEDAAKRFRGAKAAPAPQPEAQQPPAAPVEADLAGMIGLDLDDLIAGTSAQVGENRKHAKSDRSRKIREEAEIHPGLPQAVGTQREASPTERGQDERRGEPPGSLPERTGKGRGGSVLEGVGRDTERAKGSSHAGGVRSDRDVVETRQGESREPAEAAQPVNPTRQQGRAAKERLQAFRRSREQKASQAPDELLRPRLSASLPIDNPRFLRTADARYEKPLEGRPGHVYVNNSASLLVQAALEKVGFNQGAFLGLCVSADRARQAVNVLAEFQSHAQSPIQKERIRAVASALAGAVRDNPNGWITVVNADPQTSPALFRETRKEEEFHRQQRERSTEDEHVSAEYLLSDPVVSLAYERFRAQNPSTPEQNVFLELGARIGTGRWREFGLSREGAVSFFATYYDHIVARHGEPMKGIIDYAHPDIRASLGAPTQQLHLRRAGESRRAHDRSSTDATTAAGTGGAAPRIDEDGLRSGSSALPSETGISEREDRPPGEPGSPSEIRVGRRKDSSAERGKGGGELLRPDDRGRGGSAGARVQSAVSGKDLESKRQILRDLTLVGAEHMLDGAGEYPAWVERVRNDLSDLVDWLAGELGLTADQALRSVYGYAGAVAKQHGVEVAPLPAQGEPVAPPATGAAGLAEAVYQKLKGGGSLGNVTEFNKLAEQHFGASRASGQWSPKDAFDAMEAGVNRYLVERGGDLMAADAIDGLAELRDLMGRITSQGVRTEEQVKNQQFSTPPTESYVAAKVAGLRDGDVVLEPSAGNGGLAVWPKAMGLDTHVNEISERRRQMLEEVGFENPTAHDGELINSYLPPEVQPTVVLMNPPFSAGTVKSGEARNSNTFGFNHVDSALQRLAPGGRLVAILGGGRADDSNGGATLTTGPSGKWFERVASQYNVRANVRIHGREYQKYGTAFATRLIVIDKDGPTPSRNTPGEEKTWNSVVQGNVDTLEEAYNLLRDVAQSRPTRTGLGEGAGQGQSGTGLAPGAGSGRGSDRGLSGTQQKGSAGDELAGRRSERSVPVPGKSQSGPGDQRPNLGQSGPEAQRSGGEQQDRPGSDAGSGPAIPDDQRLTEPALDLDRAERSAAAEEDSEAYVLYQPTLKGPDHPGAIVETKTMATVPMPAITYRPHLPPAVLENGRLSAVQLEAVAIAGQQNQVTLPSGAYASALIGDGTGVGKGRISAAILWDNRRQGRKRIVWVSEKWDLLQDACRDLKGIGATDLLEGVREQNGQFTPGPTSRVKGFNKYSAGQKIEHEGMLFTTYALIRSGDKKGNTRVSQLEQWLRGDDDGEGAYILFDESHNLKNAVASRGTPPSQIGQAVKALLERMPKLRTVSLSATAATDVINLGYLDRLGLWGPGTAFPNGFTEFQSKIGRGGMAAMELIARELKAQGKYVSRTLSFKGVTYSDGNTDPRALHRLNEDQKEIYRSATKAWGTVIERAEATVASVTNGGGRQKGKFLSQLYGAQQRFFNLLISTLKAPTAIELANEGLAQGKSVVITLVNTNEAAQNREKNKARDRDDEDEVPDYDFGPKEMLIQLIKEHYPVQQYRDDVDSGGNPVKVPVYRKDKDGRDLPVNNPTAEAERDALVQELDRDLNMPENPLDVLVNGLGGEKKVAELTGRKEKYDAATGKFVPRGDPNAKRNEINLFEMRAFQNGKKRVAILSSAAGTGISLHAGNDVPNKQKRLHITLQVGWSADKQMQMFGRTHRTNQAHPPEYVMLVSDLGGEKRFVSTIARRLGSLGALTKGQKNATSGSDLMEKVNFETTQGEQAANAFYEGLLQDQPVPGTDLTGMQVLTDLHVLKPAPGGRGMTVPPEDRTNVTRLLNRLLGLDPDLQNAVYDYYYDIFQAQVQAAIENGTLDTGVKNLPGDEFTVKQHQVIGTDPKTGAETIYYPVDASIRTERVSPQELDRRIAQHTRTGENPRVLRDDKGKLLYAWDARPIVHANGTVEPAAYVVAPGNGVQRKVSATDLGRRYRAVGEWANEEFEQAKRNLSSAERSAEWTRSSIDRQIENERGRIVDRAENALADARARRARLDRPFETPPSFEVVQYNGQNWRVAYRGPTKFGQKVRLTPLVGNGEEKWVKPYQVSPAKFETAPPNLQTAKREADDQVKAAESGLEEAKRQAEAYGLPENHWDRTRLAEQEKAIEEAKTEVARLEPIVQNPDAWAREQWAEHYEAALSHITKEHHFIGGAVMRWWNPISDTTSIGHAIYTTADTKTGQRVVGVDIPKEDIKPLLQRISGNASTVNANQLHDDVLRNGMTYTLEGNIPVRRGRVGREQVIQLIPPNQDVAENLKRMGVKYEKGVTPIYYVPANYDSDTGPTAYQVLNKLLDEYPVKPDEIGTSEAPTFERAASPKDNENEPPFERQRTARPTSSQIPAAEYRPGKPNQPGLVYVNAAGAAALGKVWNAGGINGARLNAAQLNHAIAALEEKAPALADALRQAEAAEGQAVVTRTDRPLFAVKAGIRHEKFHAFQAALPGHLGKHEAPFLAHPLAREAAARLRAEGYSAHEIAAEIGAHLAAGQWEKIGLSRTQARDLTYHYARLLHAEHGDKIERAIHLVAPALKEAVREAQRPRNAEDRNPSRDHGEGLPEGEGSLRPGVRQDVSGKPAFSREPSFLADETGTSRVVERARELAAEWFGEGPIQGHLSGLGGFKDIFVRNLSELEGADERAYRAAVQYIGSRGQAAVLMRNAAPKIKAALKGSGVSYDNFRTALVESRLRGCRERWYGFADATANLEDSDLLDVYQNRLGGLLQAMEGRRGQDDLLKQDADAMVVNEDWDALREFLVENFSKAGDSVASLEPALAPADGFQRVVGNPAFRRALALYKHLIEQPVAANHAENEGVFSDALGPLDTYYPLIPVADEDRAKFTSTKAKPYRKPLNPSSKFATGLVEDYDTTVKALQDKVFHALRTNNKAAMIAALEKAGLIRPIAPGEQVPTIAVEGEDGEMRDRVVHVYRGVPYAAHVVPVSEERLVTQEGKTTVIPAKRELVPDWLRAELAPILEEQDFTRLKGKTARLFNALNRFSLAGPLDLVFHATNILGTIAYRVPFAGTGILSKSIGNTPVTKIFTAIINTACQDVDSEAAVRKLEHMARLGLVPARYGQETFSRKFSEETGAKLIRFNLGPTLFGPHGMDIKTRVLMYDLAHDINPNVTDKELIRFVRALGGYQRQLEGKLERMFKSAGISPFFTAGSTMYRNSLGAWLRPEYPKAAPWSGGMGPLEKVIPRRWVLRMAQMLSGAALGLLAMWMVANKAMRGKWPWEDPTSQLLKIAAPPALRRSKFGLAMWGDNNKEGMIDFGFFSPIVTRGSRSYGLSGAYNTLMAGGTPGQAFESGSKDFINSVLHPITSGPLVKAGSVATFGVEPHLTGLRDRMTGRVGPQFRPAIAKLPPGAPTALAKLGEGLLNVNSFFQNAAASLGLGEKGTKEESDGERWLRTITDIGLPRLFGQTYNPWAARESLRREQRATRSRTSVVR